jgi:ferredoxin
MEKSSPVFSENIQINFQKGIAISKIRVRIEVHSLATKTYLGGITMAYKITDACLKCGSCADNCPVEAISEGEEMFVIDADLCVDCGTCVDNCPVEAIVEG